MNHIRRVTQAGASYFFRGQESERTEKNWFPKQRDILLINNNLAKLGRLAVESGGRRNPKTKK